MQFFLKAVLCGCTGKCIFSGFNLTVQFIENQYNSMLEALTLLNYTIYNGHRGPLAKLLTVELFLRLESVAAEILTPTFRMIGESSNQLCHHGS